MRVSCLLALALSSPSRAEPPRSRFAAADAIERQVEAAGVTAEGLRRVALAWEEADQPEEAANAWERVTQVDPGDLRARRRLAELREALGHVEDALRAWQWLAQRLPDEAELWRAVGRLCVARDRDAEAAAAYERALTLAPGDTAALAALADVYGWLDRDADRARLLEALLVRNPADRAMRWSRARALLRLDRDAEAAAELERLSSGAPDDAALHAEAAALDESVGDEDREVAHRAAAYALGDTDPMSERRLARLDLDRGDTAAARPLIDELVTTLPDDAVVRIAKVDLDLQTGPVAEARYRAFVTRLQYTVHLAEAAFEASPVDSVRLRGAGGYGFREGPVASRSGARASFHEGTALVGAALSLAVGTRVDADATLEAYRGASAFFGTRLGLEQRWRSTLDLRFDLTRRLDATTIDAVAERTVVHEARVNLDWDPVKRWLVRAEGGIGDWRHTDPATRARVTNLGGDVEVATGARLLESPVVIDALGIWGAVAFKKSDGDIEAFPYFAPSWYDTFGAEVSVESAIGWRLRWGVHARPYWARIDRAVLVSYGGFVELRLHPHHVLKATFDRTDTLAGAPTLVYDENDVQATYSAVVW